jgi:hypothetical protein
MATDLNNHTEDIVDGEIVAEYTDQTMLNLDDLAAQDESLYDTQDSLQAVPDQQRRNFLTRLLMGSVAAAALGGSAALLYDQQRRGRPQVVVLPNGDETDGASVGAPVAQDDSIQAALTAMTADRDRLSTELDQANAEMGDLRVQLSDALAELEDLRRINNLWQMLDDVGLDGVVEAALEAAGGALAGVMIVISTLGTGIAIVQSLLNGFTSLLPGPQAGIRWLRQQSSGLATSLDWLAEQVQEAIEPAASFAALIADFVLWVLDRLPFGIGNQARAGMEAMELVVSDLPGLVQGITDDVLDPLAEWFSDDDEENLVGTLLNPIEDKLLEPARTARDKVEAFETVFEDELATPLRDALTQRRALRDELQQAQVQLAARV